MQKNYRKTLFIHLQGIVLVPILDALFSSEEFNTVITNNSITLDALKGKKINIGYVNVALRILRSSNLVDCKHINGKKTYLVTDNLFELYNKRNIIKKFNQLLYYHIHFTDLNDYEYNEYSNIMNECVDMINELKMTEYSQLFIERLEGVLIGPVLNNLGFNNYLDDLNNENFVLKGLNADFRTILDTILISSDLIHIDNENYKITKKGEYFLNKCSSYGVTCSYIPTLERMNDLLFEDCSFIWEKDFNNNEVHVNRAMNVWGSGGAHKTYFKKIDNIIIELFNKPIQDQPKAILDVGCGDGTFLKHVYNIIKENTLRGEYIKEYPLGIIGVDINKAARIASRKKLNSSNIDNIIINGSISSPYEINKNLIKQFKINLSDCLNMRTFLDHNRIFSYPKHIVHKNIITSGAFCYKGKMISNDELINNLIEHFSMWAPYINKFGLILLELHTLSPDYIKKNQDSTPAIAYDATHGFSDQYLIEHNIFEHCLRKSGLNTIEKYQSLFPDTKNPTISINYIK